MTSEVYDAVTAIDQEITDCRNDALVLHTDTYCTFSDPQRARDLQNLSRNSHANCKCDSWLINMQS